MNHTQVSKANKVLQESIIAYCDEQGIERPHFGLVHDDNRDEGDQHGIEIIMGDSGISDLLYDSKTLQNRYTSMIDDALGHENGTHIFTQRGCGRMDIY